jgi:hypothetical protein
MAKTDRIAFCSIQSAERATTSNAKVFDRGTAAENQRMTAGTINPRSPRKIVPAVEIASWLGRIGAVFQLLPCDRTRDWKRPFHNFGYSEVFAMRWTALFLLTIAALSSRDSLARDCGRHGGGRKLPIYREAITFAAPPFTSLGSTTGPIVGCYGFDHGPFYSPHSCILPYPCAYYGTCKR